MTADLLDDYGVIESDGPAVHEAKSAAASAVALALSSAQIDTAIPRDKHRNQHYVEIACPDCLVTDEKAGHAKPWGRQYARNGACMACGNRSWMPAGEHGGYPMRRRIQELRTEMRKVTSGE